MSWKLLNMRRSFFARTPAAEDDPARLRAGSSKPDAELIHDDGSFDLARYCRQSGKAMSLDEAIAHYLREGERTGLSPHPGFDVAFYLATYDDIGRSGVNCYGHYLRYGRSECRYPSQAALRADALKALQSGHFDSEFYRETYTHVDYSRTPPVEHYLVQGWKDGNRANPRFDTKFYVDHYPDVEASGLAPLFHFIEIGAAENRRTSIEQIKADLKLLESSDAFDEAYYRSANQLPDAEFKRMSPAGHYLLKGAARWLDPSPDFCTEYYLRKYPDLNHPDVNPLAHFVRYGDDEKRIATRPSYSDVFTKARGEHLSDRPTLLVLVHDSSQTGAPLLGLAMVQELAQRYNLIIWAGQPGPLSADIESVAFLVGYRFRDPLDCEFLLRDLLEHYPIEGAIANSVETSPVHRALLACDIPSIGLIHEFATYTLPVGRLSASVSYLDRCIFPADMVKNSALQELESIWGGRADHFVVQPQGHLPPELWSSDFAFRGEDDAYAQQQITERLKGRKVVLGAGYFQIRKGVDLFIEVARQARDMRPDDPVHFLWIGDGFAPTRDLHYSVWLQDAIDKCGLKDVVTFIDGQKSIDWAFELSDIFLLSSRLDPFPNVVVDAMAASVPVVCFEDTTGCAEFMRRTGAAGAVVPYLDTRAAAAAILSLTEQEHHKNDSAKIVAAHLSMPDYVRTLERELKLARELVTARQQYAKEIEQASCFDRAFYDEHWAHFPNDRAAVREYVAHCMKNIFKAAPYPGFNDGRYLARYDRAAAGNLIPLVHALRNSAGLRPKSHDCIEVSGRPAVGSADTSAERRPLRVALHMHLFYADLTREFALMLRKSEITADLFISCASNAHAREIEYGLSGYSGGKVTIRSVPNAGRDIGALITCFGKDILASGYDLVGHLHGKKSKVLGPKTVGDGWRNYLWDNLLAGEGVWETVRAAFAAEPRLGLLFAEDHNIVGWTKNRELAESLKLRLGLAGGLPEIPVFPIGTMFWCRPQAIARLLDSGLDWADYPAEPLRYDGSMLHALERLLPTICEQSAYAWKTIYLKGSAR